MDCGGYAREAFDQAGAGSVEEFIRDAENTAFANSAEGAPVSFGDDLFEGDAITGSAPREEKDIGICFGYGFGTGVGSGLAEESTTGDIYQFGDPLLGVDEGLAPFFAVDDRSMGSNQRALVDHLDGRFHARDEGFAFAVGVDYGGDESDVFVDVVEIMGRECEDWQAGLQNRGKRFHAVRDAGYDEVGIGS